MTTMQVEARPDPRLPDPAPGSDAVVLPVDDAPQRRAVVRDWHAGPAGLVVTADLSMDASDVAELVGHRVWVRASAPDGGTRVIEGVAGSAGRELLHLTGVVALAVETRRAAPRVATAAPVTISLEAYALGHAADVQRDLAGRGLVTGSPEDPSPEVGADTDEELAAAAAHGEVVDLSSSGARLRLSAEDVARAGRGAQVDLEVSVGGSGVRVGGEVVRVDAEAGEVAVRFVDLDDAGQATLERAVLTELSARSADDAG